MAAASKAMVDGGSRWRLAAVGGNRWRLVIGNGWQWSQVVVDEVCGGWR
ncbi:F-box domain-containing protein [Psidium guajava]|nr:F-box domain-containing protein [Psidium guajava]